MTVKDIMARIRYRLRDPGKGRVSDYEILDALNEGQRALHGVILAFRPSLIASDVSGATEVGEQDVALRAWKVLSVFVEDAAIPRIQPGDEDDMEDTGQPTAWRSIAGGVRFYPSPDASYGYKVNYIPACVDLDMEGDMPFDAEFCDQLVDYATGRIAMANFDPEIWRQRAIRLTCEREALDTIIAPAFASRARDDYGVTR